MCGIVGIADAGGVSFPLYYSLFALQHRGQESAGIVTFDGSALNKYKREGLVAEVFNEGILSSLPGKTGVGHVRYPTTGEKIPENIQPLTYIFRGQQIAVAHNGNLVNSEALRAEFENNGQIFSTTTDTEVIANLIVSVLRSSGSMEDAAAVCMKRLEGSYSVILLIDGDIYAFRDPLGIRPLCIGRTSQGHIVCSESVAIDALGGVVLRDVNPGELVRVTRDGVTGSQIARADHKAHCIFEYVYFARADSVVDGKLVYDVRRRIGKSLYTEAPVDVDLVSPVPDSGIAHAIGYSESSGVRYLEGLIKNRYMGRTFIMPDQAMRENAVRMKLNPVRGHLKNKSVVLIDDSIVRGTTSRRIISIVREAGAREVHMRIGSPPIKAPCYLGVNMPTRAELIASDLENGEVCESIGATTLHHVSIESLIRATGIDASDLCTGCLTGDYPISIGDEKCCHCRKVDIIRGTYQSGLETFKMN